MLPINFGVRPVKQIKYLVTNHELHFLLSSSPWWDLLLYQNNLKWVGRRVTWDQALFSFRFKKLHSGGQGETRPLERMYENR